jgi:hypothetical protein
MPIGELVFTIVSFLLTVLVLSYLFLGDNPLFRTATYAFIGVAAAYILLISVEQVLLPRLITPLLRGSLYDRILLLVPLLLGILLLTKLFPRLAGLGSLPMGYLVGAGAAVAIGGGLLGTLFPQTLSTINLFDLDALAAANQTQGNEVTRGMLLLDGSFTLVGTVGTLFYFYFNARQRQNLAYPPRPGISALAGVGKFFIAITFGALFAGVLAASLAALVERLSFLVNAIL